MFEIASMPSATGHPTIALNPSPQTLNACATEARAASHALGRVPADTLDPSVIA